MMSEDDKRLLEIKAPDLMKTLDLKSSTLLAALVKREVITTQQKEVIQSKEGNINQVETLVDMLRRGDKDTVDMLIYALNESGHSKVAMLHFRSPYCDDVYATGLQNTPACEQHMKHQVHWYCMTCTIPVCSECVRQEHKGHDTEKLGPVTEHFKEELVNVSKMGAKRLRTLKRLSADLDVARLEMEGKFDKTSVNIKHSAEEMHLLIQQHEQRLQMSLERARETAQKQFMKAKEELDAAIKNTSLLMSSIESSAEHEMAPCTVLQAPNIKKQFLSQQDSRISSSKCTVIRTDVQPSNLISTANFVGEIETVTCMDKQTYVQKEAVSLGEPLQTIKLGYAGKWPVCGIAPLHKGMFCVAYSAEPHIWVYSNDGELKQKLTISGIAKILGIVTVSKDEGKVAIVEGTIRKMIHLLSLSEHLELVSHIIKTVPLSPGRISIAQNKQLTISHTYQKQVVSLSSDGQLLSDINVPVPHEKVFIDCVAQTRSGFVISDRENKQVYFTDEKGKIIHTSTDVVDPWYAVQTSWGHVLIVDGNGHEIKVFSENGDFIGSVQDVSGSITAPQYLHVDEAEGLLYVARGYAGKKELRTYKFVPSDFPLLPLQYSVKKLTVNVKLASV